MTTRFRDFGSRAGDEARCPRVCHFWQGRAKILFELKRRVSSHSGYRSTARGIAQPLHKTVLTITFELEAHQISYSACSGQLQSYKGKTNISCHPAASALGQFRRLDTPPPDRSGSSDHSPRTAVVRAGAASRSQSCLRAQSRPQRRRCRQSRTSTSMSVKAPPKRTWCSCRYLIMPNAMICDSHAGHVLALCVLQAAAHGLVP